MPIPSPSEWLATAAPPDVNSLVDDAAARHGVDPHLAHSVMDVESGGRTDVVSPKGAIGAMQLMPETAKGLGVDPHDPAQNIEGGVKLLKQLTDHYGGDFNKAAAAYNAGQGAVDRAGGVPQIPETQDYVKKINERIEGRLKDPKNFPAMISPPNIPLRDRPVVQNPPDAEHPNGSSSTVSTITIESDGRGVLLPTIINGKRVSEPEAIKHWQDTGESLGVFKSENDANEYDKKLHTLMGWNGPAGGSQAAWQASAAPAPGAQVKHGIPSPSEFLDDPLNADTSDPSKLPSAEHFEAAHQTFMQRARLAFSQGAAAVQKAVADPSSLFEKPMQVAPRAQAFNEKAGELGDTLNEHGPLRLVQDALRPPVQYAEKEPTTTAGKIAQGVGAGITRTAESLTTPENLALLVGTEGLGLLPKIGAALPRAISAGFSASMFKSAYDQSPAVRQAIEKGDVKAAAQGITELVATVGLAGLAGHHAIAGEGVPRGTVGDADGAKKAESATSEVTPENKGVAISGKPAASKVPSPSDWLAGETNGPRISGQQYLKGKAGGAEPTTPAAESAKVFEQHGKTYAELFEELSDKDKAREASARGAAEKPAKPTVPAEGPSEGVARALDARERLSQDLTKKPFRELSNPDRMAVDELISEGFGQAAQPKKGFRARELEGAGPDLLEGSGPADVVRMPRPKAADMQPNGKGAEPLPFQSATQRPDFRSSVRGTEEQPLVTEVARPGTEAPAMNAKAETDAAAEAGDARRKAAGFPNWEKTSGANALAPDRGELEGKHVAQMIDRNQTLRPEVAEKLAPGSTRVNAKGGVERLEEVPLAKIDESKPTAARPEGNTIYPETVEKYRANPSAVAPELRASEGGRYEIYEGHHRVLGAVARGDKSILAWTSESGPDGFPKAQAPRPNYSVERGHFVVHEETGAPAMRVPLNNPDSVKGASYLLRHMGEDAIADQLEAAGGLKPEGKTGSEPAQVKENATAPKSLKETPEVSRKLSAEPSHGKAVKISIPGGPATYPARYSIREAADVQPSHNPFSFGKNPEFEHANDRDYESAGNAARVVEQAKQFNADYLTTDSPTAEHGAPVIDKRGNVLGGNSRAMTLARVYDEGGTGAAAYRKALTDKAESLGIKSADLARFKEPVLVRELSGSHDAQKAITDFNKKGAAELTPEERAVSDGRRFSADTVQELAGRLGDSQEGATLAEALRGEDGAKVVNQLVKDGVVTQQESNGMVDDRGHLTPEAKSRIAKALVGRLFNTPKEFTQAPPALRAKLERIAPQVLRVEGRKEWNITRLVREAIGIAEEMRAHNAKLEDLEGQPDLAGKQRDYTPAAKMLAEVLNETPRNAEYAFKRYANDEMLSRPGAQKPLYEPPTREQAFRDAFGDGPVDVSADRLPPKGWDAAPGRDDLKGGAGRVPKMEATLGTEDATWVTDLADKFHSDHAKVLPIELTPAERKGSDAYVLNAHAMEWLARAATGARDKVTMSISGLHIATDQLERLARNMSLKIADTYSLAGTPPAIKYLVSAVRNARDAKKSLIIINGHPAFTMYNEGTLEHELGHATQARVGGRSADHLGGHQDYFLDHPLAKKAIESLTKEGRYPGAKRGSLAMEIGVRLMTAGHENVGPAYAELGLRPQEARDLAAVYLRSLRKEYGNAAPREIAKEIYAKLPIAYLERGTRPPRAESAGRGGPAERARPDVPGNETQPGAAGDRAQGAQPGDNGDRGQGRTDSLFGDEGEALSKANQRDADALTKKRLEAQLAAPISREEQLKKLKRDKTKRQGGLFDGPADEAQQGGLFDASIIGAQQRRAGESLSDWRDRMEEHVGKLNTGDAVKLFAAAGKFRDDTSGRLDFGAIARKFRDGQLFKSMYDTLRPLGARVADEGDGAGKSLMKLIARAGDRGEVHAGQMLVRLADARINTLDRGQRAELLDQLEGRAKSSDPRVLEVARVMRGITDELAGVAAATGVEVRTKNGRRPFAQLDDYFPHVLRNAEALSSGPVRRDVIDNIVRQGIQPDKAAAGKFVDDWIQYLQSGKRADSILQHLVDSGQVKDKAEALAKLQRFRSNIQRHGSLEYARELNLPFYDPDPVRVLPFAAATGAKRLAQIAEFGQDHQRINQEILKISEHGGNADFARKSIDKMLGVITDGDTAEARVSRLLRAAETMKLGLSAIPNSTQGVLNSMLAADLPTVAAGFVSALSKRGKRLAIESGAAIEPVLAEAHKELGGGRMVDKYLKYTGFSQTEQFNRATAANVGAIWAKKNLGYLLDKPNDTGARARLEELGVDVDKAIARGSLTQEERLMAAKKFSDLTQFRTRPEDLPGFASTPLGRVAFQFKNFAYNQARLIAKETVDEIKAGRPGRGLRTMFVIATLFPAAGELVRLLRNGITGREQEFESDVAHYFGALSSAGTLGILQDAITSASSGKSLEFLAGPAAGDLANLSNILANKDTDVEDKLAALRKYAVQRYAGPARRLFGQ